MPKAIGIVAAGVIGAVAWGVGGVAGAGAVTTGKAEVRLDGRAAPAPSAEVCGFSVIAPGEGPQVAVLGRTGFVASVREGETVAIALPVNGFVSGGRVVAEVVGLEGETEVALALNDRGERKALRRGETARPAIAGESGAQDAMLRLEIRGRSGEGAVQWRAIRCIAEGQQSGEPDALEIAWPEAAPENVGPPPTLSALRPAIEAALIEWDWRMQDGIGTGRQASTYEAVIERTLDRGENLVRDLAAGGVDLGAARERWAELRGVYEALRATGGNDARWEELWRRAHEVRRRIALSNPLAQTGPLVFVKQVPSCFSHQLTQYYGSCAKPGGGVFVLEAPGESMRTRQLAAGALPEGSYQHPEVSFDGRRVLFAYCRAETAPPDRETCLDRFYHLYEAAADGSNLRQLTDGACDDFAPRYLPNGQIVFISTRRGGFHRCGRGPCPTYTLALANGDGSEARPISYHETHEWDPAVLNDGRVIYTRWDYVDRHAVHYEHLWTVRPDGADVRAFYGNNTLNPVGVWEARAVPGSRGVMATAAAHHAMTAGSIILLDVDRGIDGLAPITRLTPDVLFPESEEPVSNGQKGWWHAPIGVPKPPAIPVETARWPGHCYRTPFPLSETYFLAAYSFDSLIGEPRWNRANLFGLYLVDAFGNKELLYRDLNIASLWPMPLRAREKPPALASTLEATGEREGVFFLQDVYASSPTLPRGTIKRLRVVQVVPKSTPHINDPTVGLANGSPGKQVLGTVPVEADGSAYFRAPASVPLSLQALDARGQAVQMMRSVTYLQPGEKASCVGCHEARSEAAPGGPVARALERAPSRIETGPEGSRPLSYPRLVQPVLDRRCVSCHGAKAPAGGVNLTGAPEGRYTASYNALAPHVPISVWGAPGDWRQTNSEPVTRPDFFGARGSRLMQQLLEGHEGVALAAEDVERLATWMDANALFYGTFDPADQARQLRGEQIAGPAVE